MWGKSHAATLRLQSWSTQSPGPMQTPPQESWAKYFWTNLGDCPLWGLPSRVPQHRTHLGLCVCLSVCTDFDGFLPNGICTVFKHRCHSVYFQRCSKGVPKKSTFKEDWSDFQGTSFFPELFGFLCNFGCSARKPPKGRDGHIVRTENSEKV